MQIQIPKDSGWFSVQSSSTIHVPVAQVWSILTDLKHYSEWNTFVPSMESDFHVGSVLTMGVQMRANMHTTSVETITAIEPERLLAWKTRSPVWILRGERFQLVTSVDTNTTQYWTRESFKGILAPVIQLLFGKDLQRGFDSVAQNLKTHAEKLGV
jgi:hypothetical protein